MGYPQNGYRGPTPEWAIAAGIKGIDHEDYEMPTRPMWDEIFDCFSEEARVDVIP